LEGQDGLTNSVPKALAVFQLTPRLVDTRVWRAPEAALPPATQNAEVWQASPSTVRLAELRADQPAPLVRVRYSTLARLVDELGTPASRQVPAAGHERSVPTKPAGNDFAADQLVPPFVETRKVSLLLGASERA
jgi:hypothetical protein